ncbi:MAG: hypothetical protein CVV42_11390 [Candidatus Riflebacteria bacterium HGW-Riflebacteria-2]|nr:MAG: hypothetical protein CVV42_11390 [Candidatus Riflebacteria bacterium HGW-Riflebacteria-2]
MMLMMLIVIIIGSIIALQILPGEEMITRRSVEKSLDVDLSQLREAFDLAYMAGEMATDTAVSSQPIILPDITASDADKHAAIALAIASLTARGYLRSDTVRDPTVPAFKWGTDYANYWQVRENVASNPSFEISESGAIISWKNHEGSDIDATDAHAASVTSFLQSMQIDDYPYQNKLGNMLASGGAALMLTK